MQNSKQTLVDQIVQLEWAAFDKVQNQGERASCQDDWTTFSIMRQSQFLAWTEEMIQSYISDFQAANARGWNLVTEKYGRMMESTAPEEYEKIREYFPEITEAKSAIIEAIVKIQVSWVEEFARTFPKAGRTTRLIHTSEDTLYSTSYETYLRGELKTYGEGTLALYGRFIANISNEGGNLAQMIITNTAVLYGYDGLEDMEKRL